MNWDNIQWPDQPSQESKDRITELYQREVGDIWANYWGFLSFPKIITLEEAAEIERQYKLKNKY